MLALILVALVGGPVTIAQPSGLAGCRWPGWRHRDSTGAARYRLTSIADRKSRLIITDVTLESPFVPVSIVTTGPISAALIGELDLAGISTVRAALAGFDGDILLDCSGLAFIDAAGLRTLVDAHHVREQGDKVGTRESFPLPRTAARAHEPVSSIQSDLA